MYRKHNEEDSHRKKYHVNQKCALLMTVLLITIAAFSLSSRLQQSAVSFTRFAGAWISVWGNGSVITNETAADVPLIKDEESHQVAHIRRVEQAGDVIRGFCSTDDCRVINSGIGELLKQDEKGDANKDANEEATNEIKETEKMDGSDKSGDVNNSSLIRREDPLDEKLYIETNETSSEHSKKESSSNVTLKECQEEEEITEINSTNSSDSSSQNEEEQAVLKDDVIAIEMQKNETIDPEDYDTTPKSNASLADLMIVGPSYVIDEPEKDESRETYALSFIPNSLADLSDSDYSYPTSMELARWRLAITCSIGLTVILLFYTLQSNRRYSAIEKRMSEVNAKMQSMSFEMSGCATLETWTQARSSVKTLEDRFVELQRKVEDLRKATHDAEKKMKKELTEKFELIETQHEELTHKVNKQMKKMEERMRRTFTVTPSPFPPPPPLIVDRPRIPSYRSPTPSIQGAVQQREDLRHSRTSPSPVNHLHPKHTLFKPNRMFY